MHKKERTLKYSIPRFYAHKDYLNIDLSCLGLGPPQKFYNQKTRPSFKIRVGNDKVIEKQWKAVLLVNSLKIGARK